MVRRAEKKVVATNPKARHRYTILETLEAGIALQGSEVKSAREGRISLKEGFAVIRDGEVWLVNVHIAPYPHASFNPPDPKRDRKLLLHRAEIDRLAGKVKEKGLTLVPLEAYFRGKHLKILLGLAKGKRLVDRRREIRERELEREIQRALKYRR